MIDRILAGDTSDLVRSMVLGLSRAEPPAMNPLDALTLLGLRSKFKSPTLPRSAEVAAPRYDQPDAYLEDASRKLLVKLVTGKEGSASDAIAQAAVGAIKAARLGLHPFDYAILEDLIASSHAELGIQERQWLHATRPDRTQIEELYAEGPITPDTLPKLGKAQKLQALRQLRLQDASGARELMILLWPSEPAAVRVDLVHLLAAKLSPDDRAFLEGLTDDRAQSVRDAATGLLGRLRGTTAFNNRITTLTERMKVTTAGLLRRTKVLKYASACTGKPQDVEEEQRALLHGLSLEDIGGALGETAESLLAIAEKSEQVGHISILLLQQAASEGFLDLVERHQQILDDQSADISLQFLQAALPHLDRSARQRMLDISVRAKSWWFKANPIMLQRACDIIAAPLPHGAASRIVQHEPTHDSNNGAFLDSYFTALAPLVPQSLSQDFIDRHESHSRRASLYHHLLLSLPPLQS